jgi:hypothetical protein
MPDMTPGHYHFKIKAAIGRADPVPALPSSALSHLTLPRLRTFNMIATNNATLPSSVTINRMSMADGRWQMADGRWT